MDILEGDPEFYMRLLDTVILDDTENITDDGKEYQAFIYFYPRKTGTLVSSGDFRDWEGY